MDIISKVIGFCKALDSTMLKTPFGETSIKDEYELLGQEEAKKLDPRGVYLIKHMMTHRNQCKQGEAVYDKNGNPIRYRTLDGIIECYAEYDISGEKFSTTIEKIY